MHYFDLRTPVFLLTAHIKQYPNCLKGNFGCSIVRSVAGDGECGSQHTTVIRRLVLFVLINVLELSR
jgi:hypothetical protein